ncbi:MAG: ATP synthase F1 subunit delta [Nitrospinae bacterium RIFCSPLOWO2_12_FULL_47_7]|nr:MAG: ATP synthase F1 subunit delta [Nitrospinae bacterium RIFCSPLOWO2_12_FULL_47_7]
MIENIVGKRYAVALSDTISDVSRLKSALENLQSFRQAFEVDPRLSQFFAHPSVPLDNKSSMIAEICDRLSVDVAVRNMLQMLNRRKKILFLRNVADCFEGVVDERLNQIRVSAVSAGTLSAEQVEQIKVSLHHVLGKNILIQTQVDLSLIGGLTLRLGSVVIDATIKNRLALLKQAIEKEENR